MAQDRPEITQEKPQMTQDKPETVDFVLFFAVFGGARPPRVQNACREPMFSIQKSQLVQSIAIFKTKVCLQHVL